MESCLNKFFVAFPQLVVMSKKKNKKVCVCVGGGERNILWNIVCKKASLYYDYRKSWSTLTTVPQYLALKDIFTESRGMKCWRKTNFFPLLVEERGSES